MREIAALSALLFLAGCSEMQVPTAKEALSRPFGTFAPFQRGTHKERVLAAWGKPHHVISHGVDELGSAKEEWIYVGALQNVPVDYEYVSRTKHLFFEGDHLVNWKTDEPEGGAPLKTS